MNYQWDKSEFIKKIEFLKQQTPSNLYGKTLCLSLIITYQQMCLIDKKSSKQKENDLLNYRSIETELSKNQKKFQEIYTLAMQDHYYKRNDALFWKRRYYRDLLRTIDLESCFDLLLEEFDSDPFEKERDLCEEKIVDYACEFFSELSDPAQREVALSHLLRKDALHLCPSIYFPTSNKQEDLVYRGMNYQDDLNRVSYTAVVNRNNHDTVATLVHETTHDLLFQNLWQSPLLPGSAYDEVPSTVMEGSYYAYQERKGRIAGNDSVMNKIDLLLAVKSKEIKEQQRRISYANSEEILSDIQELECLILTRYFLEKVIESPKNTSEILSPLITSPKDNDGLPEYKDIGITEGEILEYTKRIGKKKRYY